MALATGLIMGGNLLGSMLATGMGARANKRIRRDMDRQISEMRGLLDQERYGDPFTRPDVQAGLARTRENIRETLKRFTDNAVRTGQTAEKTVAAGRGTSKSYVDAMSGLVGQDARRRDWAQNRYQQMLLGLKGQRQQFDMHDAQKWPQLMQNMAGLSSAAIEVFN